jgi:hypothetical protein
MKLTTIALAALLTLPATLVKAQGGTSGGAAAPATAPGSSTTTGAGGNAVNTGTVGNDTGSTRKPSAGARDQAFLRLPRPTARVKPLSREPFPKAHPVRARKQNSFVRLVTGRESLSFKEHL